jgi:hypothetical protein
MSEQGNVRLKGAIRVIAEGAIVERSNNGMFVGCVLAEPGRYEYTVDPEWSIAPGDTFKVQVEVPYPICSAVERISQTRFDVRLSKFGADPEALTAAHSVRVTSINRG